MATTLKAFWAGHVYDLHVLVAGAVGSPTQHDMKTYLCTFSQELILARWWNSQDAARMGVKLGSTRFVITIGEHAGSVTRRPDDCKVSCRA